MSCLARCAVNALLERRATPPRYATLLASHDE